jgi:hypothetical protein
MPILALQRAPNWPWSKTKLLPKPIGFNAGISTKPKLTSLRPPRCTTNDGRSTSTATQWQWSCPAGLPPTPPSHCTLGHLDPILVKLPPQRQKTTKQQRRTHDLPSAHRRCLHRIRQQRTRNPTTIPHFATRTKRQNKSWLPRLRQQLQFPECSTASSTTTTTSLPATKCKTLLPPHASHLDANATTWSLPTTTALNTNATLWFPPTTTATTDDINTTNNISMCDSNLNPGDDTTIDKSHEISGHHTNIDTDTSNNRPLYTSPTDDNTSYDPTNSIDPTDPYTPTFTTHETDQVLTPQQRITRSIVTAAQRQHTVRVRGIIR